MPTLNKDRSIFARPPQRLSQRPPQRPPHLVVRPAGEADHGAILDMFGRCSPETMSQRFFGAGRALSPRVLKRLTDRRAGWALVVEAPNRDLIGLGNLVLHGNGWNADMAILVEDRWQRRRVGTALMRWLVSVATAEGITTLEARTLPGNTRLLAMLRRLDLPARQTLEPGLVTITIDLSDAVGLGAARGGAA